MPPSRLLNQIKQNPRDRTLDLLFFLCYKHIISLKNNLSPLQGKSLPSCFRATVAAVFVLIHWLREFPLSAVADPFKLECQSKQLLLLHYKICPCFTI